tara:strand:+ start:1674 stop:2660 length:987 start_codon:yes stop_codon:yes gene_type:complete
MSRSHSFSVDVAASFGVNCALMLQHFCFWYLKNKSDNVNFHKGDYWVRMKQDTLLQYLPYFNKRQLRHLTDKMVNLQLLKQDQFNQRSNDRTKWYSLTDEAKKILNILSDKIVTPKPNSNDKIVTPKPNPNDKNVSPSDKIVTEKINSNDKNVAPSDKIVTSIYKEDIKDRYYYSKEKILSNKSLLEILAMQQRVKISTVVNKLDEFVLHSKSLSKNWENDKDLFTHFSSWIRKFNLKDVDLEKEIEWFMMAFNKLSGRTFKITEPLKASFAVQYSAGFTGKDMKIAIANLYSSSIDNAWHKKSGFKFATPEYLLKEDNVNKYLNLKF